MFRIDFKGLDKKLFSKIDARKQKLIRLLADQQTIWVLYLDVVKFSEVEFRLGYKICNFILEALESEIKQTLKQQRHLFHLAFTEGRGGDDFVVYFIPNEHTPWGISDLIEKWVAPLENRLNNKIEKWVNEKIDLRAGIVPCSYTTGRSADYLIYAAVKEAFYLNKAEPDPLYFARREEVLHLLNEPNLYLKSAFQPIIHVQSGEIFGFEALARINGDSAFNHIGELFPFSEKIGKLYAIETLCRRKAISSARSVLRKNELLFLNINPQVLSDPEFATGQTRQLLDMEGLHPSDVVLEITEQSAIKDFPTFREALAHYRNQGYFIALDDVGAGYSSLQSIAELHPDFLKIDRSLICEINKNPTKWALLETFVNFSKRIGCRILAEGVETEEEMRTVVQLGVDYVQGFFVAKPQFERATLNEQSLDIINISRKLEISDHNTILSLVEPLPLFDSGTVVKIIDDYFRNHPNEWLIGITDKTRISGILKREKLYASLGTRYGTSLYSERPISLLMDKNPLIVEDTTPIEVVSSIAMERPHSQLYDGIIVTNQQKPIGKISISSLIRTMTDRQIQIARGANPLTGLPGNIRIDEEIRARLDKKTAFEIVYADLNKFKHFNDQHGFQRGDQMIKALSEVLICEALKTDEQAFIGHVGGDDFILVLQSENLKTCCENILSSFQAVVSDFSDANGLSVALACLQVDNQLPWTPAKITETVAQIKKQAKDMGGNAYLIG